MDENLELEFEALIATYGDNVTVRKEIDGGRSYCVITLLLQPRVLASHEVYLTGNLQLIVSPGYPDESPAIKILDTKGLGDQRLSQLRQSLLDEASALAGEMALGALCEHALDWVTAENHPEGLCAFCLCPMQQQAGTGEGPQGASRSGAEQAEEQLVCLPCYHGFHRSCYVSWWCWRQQSLEAQERALVRHTGVSAASVLKEQDLPPREDCGAFETCCPVCRTPAPLSALGSQLREQLAAARRDALAVAASTAIGGGAVRGRGGPSSRGQPQPQPQPGGSSSGRGSRPVATEDGDEQPHHWLSPQELAEYKEVQARHAALLARQRAAGGLIEQACYSIAGWTLGAEPAASPQPSAAASASGTSCSCSGSATSSSTAAASAAAGGDGHPGPSRGRHAPKHVGPSVPPPAMKGRSAEAPRQVHRSNPPGRTQGRQVPPIGVAAEPETCGVSAAGNPAKNATPIAAVTARPSARSGTETGTGGGQAFARRTAVEVQAGAAAAAALAGVLQGPCPTTAEAAGRKAGAGGGRSSDRGGRGRGSDRGHDKAAAQACTVPPGAEDVCGGETPQGGHGQGRHSAAVVKDAEPGLNQRSERGRNVRRGGHSGGGRGRANTGGGS